MTHDRSRVILSEFSATVCIRNVNSLHLYRSPWQDARTVRVGEAPMWGRETEARRVAFASRRPTRRTPDGTCPDRNRGRRTWSARVKKVEAEKDAFRRRTLWLESIREAERGTRRCWVTSRLRFLQVVISQELHTNAHPRLTYIAGTVNDTRFITGQPHACHFHPTIYRIGCDRDTHLSCRCSTARLGSRRWGAGSPPKFRQENVYACSSGSVVPKRSTNWREQSPRSMQSAKRHSYTPHT